MFDFTNVWPDVNKLNKTRNIGQFGFGYISKGSNENNLQCKYL